MRRFVLGCAAWMINAIASPAAAQREPPFTAPAYPGAAPSLSAFHNEGEFEAYLRWRIETLLARELVLTDAGRPPRYRWKRRLSLAAAYTGGGVALWSLFGIAIVTGTPHGDAVAFVPVLAAGALVAGVGAYFVIALGRRNLHAAEIAALRDERKHWSRELKDRRIDRAGRSQAGPLELGISAQAVWLRTRFW